MPVDVHGCADVPMPQDFLNHFCRNAHTQQNRSRAMSEIMEVHSGQIRLMQQLFEDRIEPHPPKVPSLSIGEDQSLLFPASTGFEPHLQLVSTMRLQCIHRHLRKHNTPPAVRSFRFSLDPSMSFNVIYGMAYLQYPLF